MSNGVWEIACGLPCSFPCRFPARRDLDAELQPPDMDRAFGGIAVAQIEGWWSERLPRGQRVLDGLAGVRAGGRPKTSFRDSKVGLDGNERAECRVGSVKHSSSPSRRENARRAIKSPVFQSQSAATEHSLVRPLRRRVSQSASSTRSRSPRSRSLLVGKHLVPPCRIPCPERAERKRHTGKSRHRTAALILL